MSKKVAIVTGSNKGIGFSIVKRLCSEFDGDVFLTARNVDNGNNAINSLKQLGLNAKFHQLDVESIESINTFRDFLKQNYDGIDVLVNNAGVYIPNARQTMSINYYGCLNLSTALFPLLKSNSKVINIASMLGLLSRLPNEDLKKKVTSVQNIEQLNQIVEDYIKSNENGTSKQDGYPTTPYEMSKIALITMTRLHQNDMNSDKTRSGIVVTSVCPGYCATDLNNHSGHLTADQGAETPLYLIQNNATNGGDFWSEKRKVDWHTESFDYVVPTSF